MTTSSRTTPRTPPWEGPDNQGITFGTWLRRQREVREIELKEIADSTKVSLRYLQAFEQDRFELLPALVFSRGFLRQYAECVGLDPDEVLNSFLWAINASQPEEEEPEEVRRREVEANRSILIPVLILVVALVALVAGLLISSGDEEEAAAESQEAVVEDSAPATSGPNFVPPVRQAAAPAPAVEPPPPEPSAPLVVTLEFTRDCWVEAVVRNAPEGRDQRISQTFWQGESLTLEAQRAVVLRKLGNAGGVQVEVNGLPFELGGREGQVINDLRIDLETAAELRAADAGAADAGGGP
ncbi:MAG: helix-turn-helix domain-containing protein [Acidobacteriota bacterium]